MVEVRRVRAPEVPLARFFIALFSLAVLAGIYYIAGGPIPYFITYSGPAGTAFQGRYLVSTNVSEGLTADAGSFRGVYPETVTVWGSRQEGVVAASRNARESNALNAITVRRAGVVCAGAYRWGTSTSVVCNTP